MCSALIDTRLYLAVTSDSLALNEISLLLQTAHTDGWSRGEMTVRGYPRDYTLFIKDSGCSNSSSVVEHLEALIEPAEQIAEVVSSSSGLLNYCWLEIVEPFTGTAYRLLVLDRRWLKVLAKVNAWIDVDQYVDLDVTDQERPDVSDDVMIGQTLRFVLFPESRGAAHAIEVTQDPSLNDERQQKMLRDEIGQQHGTSTRYSLQIEQRISLEPWAETGFALTAETLAEIEPHLNEIRLYTEIIANGDLIEK